MKRWTDYGWEKVDGLWMGKGGKVMGAKNEWNGLRVGRATGGKSERVKYGEKWKCYGGKG